MVVGTHVVAVVGDGDHHALGTEGLRRLGERFQNRLAVNAEHQILGFGRVREGAEQVHDGLYAEGTTNRAGKAHGAVVNRSHEEYEVRLVNNGCSLFRSHVELEARCGIEVSGTRLTRNSAVAVLGHLGATACSDKARERAHVEATLAVATGTHDVGEFVAAVRELALLAAQNLGAACNCWKVR